MNVKKNMSKFTIKFNLANPRQQEAMRMLNEVGRGKAVLIADALHIYTQYLAIIEDALLHGSKRESSQSAMQKTYYEGFAPVSTINDFKACDDLTPDQSSSIDVNKSIDDSLAAFND